MNIIGQFATATERATTLKSVCFAKSKMCSACAYFIASYEIARVALLVAILSQYPPPSN